MDRPDYVCRKCDRRVHGWDPHLYLCNDLTAGAIKQVNIVFCNNVMQLCAELRVRNVSRTGLLGAMNALSPVIGFSASMGRSRTEPPLDATLKYVPSVARLNSLLLIFFLLVSSVLFLKIYVNKFSYEYKYIFIFIFSSTFVMCTVWGWQCFDGFLTDPCSGGLSRWHSSMPSVSSFVFKPIGGHCYSAYPLSAASVRLAGVAWS